MRYPLSDRLRLIILVSFVCSALGIVVQILGGWDYPTIPPGLLITLAGGLVALLPQRWAPVVTVLVGAFILIGFVAVGDFANMMGTENAAVTVGKWLQFAAIAIGTGAAIVSMARPGQALVNRMGRLR